MRPARLIMVISLAIFLMGPVFLQVVESQLLPPELVGCVDSLTGGNGDPDQCCLSNIIQGITGLIGVPVLGDLVVGIINPLLSLCCLGDITGLELSCCVGALIFFEGSPVVDTCCGLDVITTNNAACCLSGAGVADLCVCLDPEQLGGNTATCCSIPDYNASFYDACCSTANYNTVQIDECCNQSSFQETSGTEIDNCCGNVEDILTFPACCQLDLFPETNIDDFITGCCRSQTDFIEIPSCCGTAGFNTEQINNCCSSVLISQYEMSCCTDYYGDLLDQSVCVPYLTAACTAFAGMAGARSGRSVNAEDCCSNPALPSAGTPWEFHCLYLKCNDAFEASACCIPEFESEPFAEQCPPPTTCTTDFNVDTCCTGEALIDNTPLCCAAGPDPDGLYEIPSQIERCCTPGTAFDGNILRCCSPQLTNDLVTPVLPQCCSAEHILTNYDLCCGTFFDQYTTGCNQILVAQCAANAQGGAAAPGPNFDAAVCCRNPGIPSAGSAWEFDCLYLDCTTAFNEAACCVPQLANAPFAAQCPPPSTCVTDFDVNACCSATEIASNVPICCAAGPNPNGLYELPSQIASCCAAGTAFDGNILRCCSTEISDALVTPVLPRCCSAEHILTNYDLCCDTFFDEYSTECNQILTSRCAANAQGGVIAPGPNFDAGVCCGNPAIPSAGSLWEYDCLYLECSTAFDPAACCVSQFTNAPFAAQCPPPTTCVTNFDVDTCCSASQIGNNIPICCAAGPQADGVYALPSQIATCCAAGIPFDGNILRCCSPQLDAGLALSMQEQCCAPTQITANAGFCCTLFYDEYAIECGDIAAQCTASANGGTAAPGPNFNPELCCNNPNLPSAGTPWELDCVYVECLATFVEATCCVTALNPSTTPWAEDCQDVPPPLPPSGGSRSSVLNLQRLNITNINSTGNTNIGIINNPGYRPRSALLRQSRRSSQEL